MPTYSYSIAVGHNVALASLTNIENIPQFQYHGAALPPSTQPVDLFPVRERVLSGKEIGGGTINHVWTWQVLPIAALEYIEDTFLSSGTVTWANVTIYTRKHNQQTYGRFNAYIILPQPNVDYTYRQRRVLNLNLRFRNLVAL